MQKEKVIESLEFCINHRCGWNCHYAGIDECEMELKKDALAMLKAQEESIPISWLKEKLEGHPELSYAVTDGIINVLDLWGGR